MTQVRWLRAVEASPGAVRRRSVEATGLRSMCTHFAPADGCGAKCDRFISALSANRSPECTNFVAIGSCSAKCGQPPRSRPPPPSRGRQDPGMTGKTRKPNPAETAEARKRPRPAACDRCHVEKAVVLIDEGRQNR
jgi:hypothetical protein